MAEGVWVALRTCRFDRSTRPLDRLLGPELLRGDLRARREQDLGRELAQPCDQLFNVAAGAPRGQ